MCRRYLEELSADDESERQLINSALLGQELAPEVATVSTYSEELMESLLDMNVSYNALFHKVEWLLSVKTLLKTIKDVFFVFRGSRRGWDPLFYPKHGEHSIEQQFLKKVLMNARKVTTLNATADSDAFCCSKTIEELQSENYCGALSWIEKFIDQKNGVGKPLPEVLKQPNMKWYELQDNEVAKIFTMMNPDQRLFFGRFESPSFLNQRLIGLKHRPEYHDEELNHALLNSTVQFFVDKKGMTKDMVAILSLVAMQQGIDYLHKIGYTVLAAQIMQKGITGRTDGNEEIFREVMEAIENLIKVKDDFKFGYSGSEALIKMVRTPNNTFPVYWLKNKKNPHAPFPR